jgi:hypothetical protein
VTIYHQEGETMDDQPYTRLPIPDPTPSPSTSTGLYALIAQLSDRERAVFVAVAQRMIATKGAGPIIPGMTVTVSIEAGPTVRLAYDPRRADERVPGWTRQNEIVVPCSTVSLGLQLGTPAPTWLKDLLGDTAAYLLMYAADEDHWPPEFRPVAASDGQEHVTPPT